MGAKKDIQFFDDKGLRLDGRKVDELRPLRIEAGVLNRPDGSAYLEWGNNRVIAGAYGPREAHPRHRQDPVRSLVQCRYNMAPFSVTDRKRPGPDRRSMEISKISSEALSRVVQREHFPRATVDVFVEILQADAGTRCAGLTAAAVAVADAGIPMTDLVASCAAGKVGGQVVLDLNGEEDNYGEADLPTAIAPRTGEIVLLQMDGHFTEDEFYQALDLAMGACQQIYQVQAEALRSHYPVEAAEEED